MLLAVFALLVVAMLVFVLSRSLQLRRMSSTIALPIVAVSVFAGSLWANTNRDAFHALFGPPVIEATEVYQDSRRSAVFDHSAFDALLRRHVDTKGLVDYRGLKKNKAKLDAYTKRLAAAKFDALGRDEKLAFLINAYNAFTLTLIVENIDLPRFESIRDKRLDGKRWKHRRWKLLGKTLSLDDIEHKEIRPKFREPRIHWAVVCAAIGCPPLHNAAFTGKKLEAQLAAQQKTVHSNRRWYRFDPRTNRVGLTKLYDWYGTDFKQAAGSVLGYVAKIDPKLKKAIAMKKTPKITWLDYDWKLNQKK